jgi:hypothetical protein
MKKQNIYFKIRSCYFYLYYLLYFIYFQKLVKYTHSFAIISKITKNVILPSKNLIIK